MPSLRAYRVAYLLASLLPFAVVHAEDDGKRLFEPCAMCHGASGEGNRELGAPRIAGLPDWYTTRQLRNFRKGIRGADPDADANGNQMARMAEQLWDDNEVVAVAGYISELKAPRAAKTLREKPAAKEFMTCPACHGENAAGNVDTGAPPLTGLDDWYVVKQLRAFVAGTRGAHAADTAGQQMRAAAAVLTDEKKLTGVAAYLGTLR